MPVNYTETNLLTEDGIYSVVLKDFSFKPTKKGGEMLSIYMEEKNKGGVFLNLNVQNENDLACQIAYGTFLKLFNNLPLVKSQIRNYEQLEEVNSFNDLWKKIIEEELYKRLEGQIVTIKLINENYVSINPLTGEKIEKKNTKVEILKNADGSI